MHTAMWIRIILFNSKEILAAEIAQKNLYTKDRVQEHKQHGFTVCHVMNQGKGQYT